MAQSVVRITFTLKISMAEFEQATMPAAQSIASVDGLLWKIWSLSDSDHEFCGVYLFTDEAAAAAYVDGPIVAHLKGAFFHSGIAVKVSAVIASLTSVTRGPVKEQASTT
jgi:hypothetical protein